MIAKEYMGFAADCVQHLSKLSGNKIFRNSTVVTFISVADFANTIYDISDAFKKFITGEITKADFMLRLGEKGTGAVVSSVYAALGTVIAGPTGAVAGSAVGYYSNSLLYGSVLKAFEDAEIARKNYETMHIFYDYYIRETECRRQEFERKVAQFLADRRQVIYRSLNQFEASLKSIDFDSVNDALYRIAHEFGGKLQFKTFKELDSFMSDKNSCLEL